MIGYLHKFQTLTSSNRSVHNFVSDDIKTLEELYISCADIYCTSSNSCCNNENLNSIQEKDYDQLILKTFQPILNEIEKISNEELSKPECEKNQSGTIIIKNLSSNPYYLYQGDKLLETISGNSAVTYDVSVGTYYFTAKQKSGYVFYPTVNERIASIFKPCQTVTLTVGYED